MSFLISFPTEIIKCLARYKEIPLVENPHDDEIRTKEYYDYWKQNNPKKVIKAKEGIVEELKPFLPSVKSWYFAGGEPLITPEHSELLNYLHKTKPTIDIWGRQKKDVSIHYNTNLSILRFEKYNFLDIWFDFNKVFLSISCDGIGEIGEYQRTGFKTDVFIKNLKEIKKYFQPANSETQEVGYGYNFQYTTTIYNVFHIWDFYKFMLDEGYIEHERNIDFYYAWAPRRSALKYLPEADKPRVVEYLTDLLTKFKEPTTINKIDRTELIERFFVRPVIVSDMNIAPPVSCKAIESIIVEATRRYTLKSRAETASLILRTLKTNINAAPITAAAVILKIPVEAKKTVNKNINLALTANTFDGR